jgi:alkylation response protein AidB-like acyl-CoA dehydrogenase
MEAAVRRTVYTADHEALRDVTREYLDRTVWPRVEEFIERRGYPRDLWLDAGAQGLLGTMVPEAYGGGGSADWRNVAVITEELAKVSMALASSVGIHIDVVAPYLVELTTEEQRQRWLPGFCSGEIVTAIAMTEPSAGSDLAAIRSVAVRDGDNWVLNGSKTFITNGGSADLIIVAAKTAPDQGAKGITLFAVEAGMPGFERGRKLDKVGQPEADTAELSFTDVRVPAVNVVGEVDNGFAHMMRNLVQERLGSAVSNISHARQILDETLTYVRDRTVFGQPVGSFQHNKFKLAELVTLADATLAFVDACVLAYVDGELSPADAAKAKWLSAQTQNDILDECLQLHGGYGFMNEYRVGRAWRDARVTKIWAGSNEIMKELIGRDLGL